MLYEARGMLTYGVKGKEVYLRSRRLSRVAYAALDVAVEELLRAVAERMEESQLGDEGLVLSVTVMPRSTPTPDTDMAVQRRADERELSARQRSVELTEGEWGSSWTLTRQPCGDAQKDKEGQDEHPV
jgi:hypothetical protein